MKRIIYVFIFFISLFLCSCESGTTEHWIDNPTDKEIVVNIDGEDIRIAGKSGVYYDFFYGKHTLKYNGESVNFIVKPSKINLSANNRAIVNPTMSNYVVYTNIYMNRGDERAEDWYIEWLENNIARETKVIINDSIQELKLPFFVDNNLFLEYELDYGINEEFPNAVTFKSPMITRRNRSLESDKNYQAGQFQTTKRKLYREDDFIAFVNKEDESLNLRLLPSELTYSTIVPLTMPNIDYDKVTCEEGREFLKKYIAEIEQWLNMKDDEFVDLYYDEFSKRRKLQEMRPKCLQAHPNDFSFNEASNQVSDVLSSIVLNTFSVVE